MVGYIQFLRGKNPWSLLMGIECIHEARNNDIINILTVSEIDQS